MMPRRPLVLRWSLWALLLLAACGPDTRVRIARLDGSQAAPPNDSPATGTAFGSLQAFRRLEIEGAFGNLRAPLLAEDPISVRDVSDGEPGAVVRVLEVDAPEGTSGAFYGHLELSEEQLGAYLNGDWVVVIATEAYPEGEIRGGFTR